MCLDFLVDVSLNDGKLAGTPLVVGPVEVVVAECFLCLFMTALETEPARRLANEENTDSQDEGGDALDGETQAPLVRVVPLALTHACPEGYEESPSHHWGLSEKHI